MIQRLGSGALGGKGEGLALIDGILGLQFRAAGGPVLADAVAELRIDAPRTLIVGVDIFEEFMREGGLREAASAAYAEGGSGYAGLREAFLSIAPARACRRGPSRISCPRRASPSSPAPRASSRIRRASLSRASTSPTRYPTTIPTPRCASPNSSTP